MATSRVFFNRKSGVRQSKTIRKTVKYNSKLLTVLSTSPTLLKVVMNYARLDLTLDPQEEVRCKLKFREVIKKVLKQTHFSVEECEALLIVHHKFSRKEPIKLKLFRRMLYTLFGYQNDHLIDRIFSAFDRTNRGFISMESWLVGMSIFLRGNLEERILYCFKVYDMMGDGQIKKEHMFLALKNSYRNSQLDEDTDEMVRDLIDMIMKKMDRDRDGILSFEDYSQSVRENPYLLEMMGYCLPSRPAVYAFMTTFTKQVTTMHAMMFMEKRSHKKSTLKTN